MALVNDVQGRNSTRFTIGDKNAVLVETTFDSAYPAGGEAFNPADFGIQDPTKAKVFASPRVSSVMAPGVIVQYDRVNAKLVVTGVTDSAIFRQMTGCDLSCLVVDILIVEND